MKPLVAAGGIVEVGEGGDGGEARWQSPGRRHSLTFRSKARESLIALLPYSAGKRVWLLTTAAMGILPAAISSSFLRSGICRWWPSKKQSGAVADVNQGLSQITGELDQIVSGRSGGVVSGLVAVEEVAGVVPVGVISELDRPGELNVLAVVELPVLWWWGVWRETVRSLSLRK